METAPPAPPPRPAARVGGQVTRGGRGGNGVPAGGAAAATEGPAVAKAEGLVAKERPGVAKEGGCGHEGAAAAILGSKVTGGGTAVATKGAGVATKGAVVATERAGEEAGATADILVAKATGERAAVFSEEVTVPTKWAAVAAEESGVVNGRAVVAKEWREVAGLELGDHGRPLAATSESTVANEEPMVAKMVPKPLTTSTSEPTETPTTSAVATSVPEPPTASTSATSEPTEPTTPSMSATSEPTETPTTSTSTISVLEPTSALMSATSEPTKTPTVSLTVILEATKPRTTSPSSILESTETPPTLTVATSKPTETPPTSTVATSKPTETPPTSTVATSKPTETPLTSTSTISVLEPTTISTPATMEPSPAALWGSPGERSLLGANGPGRGSQGSLEPGDLDSVSVLSGTLESLASSFPDDVSSMGSDSEVAAPSYRRTDRYGFLGGSQYSEAPESSVPVDVARQRELKWLEMFNHWDKWLTRRYQKVKLRCRKGIPSSLRARAWQLLSDSKSRQEQNPGLFQELERQAGEPRWLDAIEKDLHRQFPFHEMFAARGGHGQQDLYRILKAYTVLRPQEGYCQAQAPVAAVLLMQMPAEQAFWCLVQICDKYLPGYYSAGLEALQLDGEVFGALLRRAAPAAHRHLRRLRVEPLLYLTEWFMCLFARSLPWAAVLRVWDMFFCEGVKVLFRVGLVLLRQALGSAEKLRSCPGMYETLERLRSVPPPGLHEDNLVLQVSSVPLSESLLERETSRQLRRRLEARGEPLRPPPPRLHGARAIHAQRLRGELQERTRGQAPVDAP